MAGKNSVQKILARAAGKSEVSTGEYLTVRSKRPVTLAGDSYSGRGAKQMMDCGAVKVFNPEMVKIVVGHAGAGGPFAIGDNRRKLRLWAEEMGVLRENVFDLGQQGIEHVIAGEQCWALPGELYLSVADGHTTALGALGGFAVTLSYESGAYLVKGSTWIEVPEVARLTLNGQPGDGVYARDVYEYVLGQIGETGTAGQVIKWDGDYVTGLDMDGRFTLCANALFSSAWTAIIEADETTLRYVHDRSDEPVDPLYSDPDAEFASQRTFDVSSLGPQIVPPPERATASPVADYEGTKLTRGHVGSCANGRLDDMRMAARVLTGRKVHPDVLLNITPGSTEIYRQCLQEGILEIFMDAGVFLPAPSCGMCAGWLNTPLGDGDICISSGTCNYTGRMGSPKADIYLGSPATVAASAVAGYITDPRNFL